MNIILTGFRGSGKSSVGRELARRLGLEFVDTDEQVEQLAGMTIAEIFETGGEARFREYEKQAVLEARAGKGQVIALGGGVVENPELVTAVRKAGVVVLLTAPAEVLHERIERDKETARMRPALTGSTGLAEVKELLARRHAAYRDSADLTVDTAAMTPGEVAQEIERMLREGEISDKISAILA